MHGYMLRMEVLTEDLERKVQADMPPELPQKIQELILGDIGDVLHRGSTCERPASAAPT